MKTHVLILIAGTTAFSTFAQGKVSFANDSLHLVYYGSVAPTDAALGGQAVSSGFMPNGVTLVADLYIGTSSTDLSLVSSSTFSAIPGKWNTVSVISSIAAGVSTFMEVQIRDQAFAAPLTLPANPFGTYYGTSEMFNFTLGSGVTYPVMWGVNGTWAAGTFPLDQVAAGFKGAIQVNVVPEPASFALIGLGIAAVTIFRRRFGQL